MKAMITAAARINEIRKTATISYMVNLWNSACRTSLREDCCINQVMKRKGYFISLIDEKLAALTPETEVIAATLVREGDEIYNAATGERYRVCKATISDPNCAILANRGPQTFFDHDELVTIVKRDTRVHTRDDMTMAQIPAGEVQVGTYVYVCGFYRLVTKVTVLVNNVRYEGEGFSVILGKSVMVDVGVTYVRADCVRANQRVVNASGKVVTIQAIVDDTDNTLLIKVGGRWREAYRHTRLSVL